MNIAEMEKKFELRKYSITEIDELREQIIWKFRIGLYKPTEEHRNYLFYGKRQSHPDPVAVEERARTLMIAGLTAADLIDTPEAIERADSLVRQEKEEGQRREERRKAEWARLEARRKAEEEEHARRDKAIQEELARDQSIKEKVAGLDALNKPADQEDSNDRNNLSRLMKRFGL